jgi:hypothetical protein
MEKAKPFPGIQVEEFASQIPLEVDSMHKVMIEGYNTATLKEEYITVIDHSLQTSMGSLPSKAPATTTGTCTSVYVVALTWTGLQSIPKKTIIIANTHATLTMKYRIRGYAKAGSTLYDEMVAETTLAASTFDPWTIEDSYDVITVEVIDGSGHATYAIDYSGGQ